MLFNSDLMVNSTEKKFKFKHLPKLIKETYFAWDSNEPWRASAAVAYYAVLSLPGLLVIIVNIVGSIWGREIVQGKLHNQIAEALGRDSATVIENLVTQSLDTQSSLISTIIGITTILFGATGVFFQLQISLNKIWRVESSDFSFWKLLGNRAKSLAFILVIGFLLLISFILTTALSALSDYLRQMFPNIVVYLAYLFDMVVSLGVISTLFALMFQYMPDTKIRWKTVWIGAVITALLFILGKFLLGLYFGESNPASTYGAAGSIVLVLLWVSYSCLIFFFGAEFTRIYSVNYGHDSHTEQNKLDYENENNSND